MYDDRLADGWPHEGQKQHGGPEVVTILGRALGESVSRIRETTTRVTYHFRIGSPGQGGPVCRPPAEQQETNEAVTGLKAVREAGQSFDRKPGLRRTCRTSEEEGPAGIPNILRPSPAEALNELGKA